MRVFYSWNDLEEWMAANVPMFTTVGIFWYDTLHASRTALKVYRDEHNTYALLVQ